MKKEEIKNRWIPETIGNYKIIGQIGRGGMGDIYRAVQKSLNRIVALKVLAPQMGRSEEFSQRFKIEAKAISLLEHQNIVNIYDYGEENGLKYFAMQYVDGQDLGRLIEYKLPIPISNIINYSRQICRALRYAHSRNVIHRDIKPQNVLIDKNNTCMLTDFGIAKMFAETNITVTGMAVGTPEYMSPEQAEGDNLDDQTDIYSLGIVIYEMLTKRPPFTGNNPIAIAYKQVHELPIPPSAIRKDTPKRLELIVLKALKKNRMERYKTVEGMLNDLDTVDIDEHVEKSTLSLSMQKAKTKMGVGKRAPANRRITDRRSGSRRRVLYNTAYSIFSREYWLDLWQRQGLSLVLIAILSIILALHLLGYF